MTEFVIFLLLCAHVNLLGVSSMWLHIFRGANIKLLINWLSQNCAFRISDTGFISMTINYYWESSADTTMKSNLLLMNFLIVQSALKSCNKTTLWFTSVVSLCSTQVWPVSSLIMKLQSNLCFANQVAQARISDARWYLIKLEGSTTSLPVHKRFCSSAENAEASVRLHHIIQWNDHIVTFDHRRTASPHRSVVSDVAAVCGPVLLPRHNNNIPWLWRLDWWA